MKKKTKGLLCQIIFIVIVVAIWQIVAYNFAQNGNANLFPSIGMIFEKMIWGFTEKGFGGIMLHSLLLMLEGLGIGIVLAIVLSGISVISDSFAAVYNMVVSMFDLIPGIALISAIIIFLYGQNDIAIVILVVHSVVWPMSRSIIDGFNAVPKLYLEVGQNIGLSPIKLLFGVFIPAAMPRIFSGIKVGWARAWRGLISAEMVFGGAGTIGMGYYITQRRDNSDLASIYATIIIIIMIGLVVEYGIFRTIENRTFKTWCITL
ncbi:ABC transporter permease [uncultured Eubacterium sp.]|uniref:ABC transporter permease n=1 Tax=uncultured Eubacterium sp. TaxID=165185 RepID=UPI002670888F|nr:ABC transporter permease subunit [uncultured Eubacterium sp.]